ncbi:ABC transporter ATP-binding protein [Oceanidesulfovibrio marinus]|uniref:ABC transporter ATP-binding protein n=1 Tax=Oceanidesulfovibrio marinus TaxID=370038 RepID=A0ABX6NFB2_9BACT|nr:ABC transporter ATP-binding protein [Oceanidesulfovibrio marinus]QJT09262.1 ABC transporter ATP-binding protein [Oceanidesulfovibrio marinus]
MSLLEIQNMTQRFGGLTAVSDFSVRLEERQLCGLIGPNGAGKTTIFNLVSGFYTPTVGDIYFAGEKITGKKPHKVTGKGVARTFQNIRLWHDMTVLDNIRVSQHYHLGYGFLDSVLRSPRYNRRTQEIDDWAFEILEALDLARYAEEFPKNLPYGLRRRVEIARALSTKPKLLLLDEPAAGLNTADLDGLISLIRWIFEKFDISIWMIEHQMQVVMTLCQHIQVIDFGATIAQGSPKEIQNNPEVIRAYLGDDTI